MYITRTTKKSSCCFLKRQPISQPVAFYKETTKSTSSILQGQPISKPVAYYKGNQLVNLSMFHITRTVNKSTCPCCILQGQPISQPVTVAYYKVNQSTCHGCILQGQLTNKSTCLCCILQGQPINMSLLHITRTTNQHVTVSYYKDN